MPLYKEVRVNGRKVRNYFMGMFGCLYLNESGSRWVDNDRECALVLPDGQIVPRVALFYEAFGNHVAFYFKYAGLRYRVLPNWEGRILGLPVLVLANAIPA